MSLRDRFSRYPDGQRPNDLIKDDESPSENPFDPNDPHWVRHDPTYENRRYDNGDWWNWPALIALVLITSWVLFSWRGVGLAMILSIGVAILVLERTGTWVVAALTIIVTLLVAAIYFFIVWQSM